MCVVYDCKAKKKFAVILQTKSIPNKTKLFHFNSCRRWVLLLLLLLLPFLPIECRANLLCCSITLILIPRPKCSNTLHENSLFRFGRQYKHCAAMAAIAYDSNYPHHLMPDQTVYAFVILIIIRMLFGDYKKSSSSSTHFSIQF